MEPLLSFDMTCIDLLVLVPLNTNWFRSRQGATDNVSVCRTEPCGARGKMRKGIQVSWLRIDTVYI